MSIIAFARVSANQQLRVDRFCENVWIDSKGDCITVVEIIISNKNSNTSLSALKIYFAGEIFDFSMANDLYDNARYCNWYYSRKGFKEISSQPRVIMGDDLEFQPAAAEAEFNYYPERDMTQVTLVFRPVVQMSRAGLIIKFRQKNYAKKFRHQWTVDERIYDRKSILAKSIAIDTHIEEEDILPFEQGYIWVIIPPKKIVSLAAPEPRNLRHMEEPGFAMLGPDVNQKQTLRMMIHWRTGSSEGAWDAKRFSAIYVDQPLPYWATWTALWLAILSIILTFVSLLFGRSPGNGEVKVEKAPIVTEGHR